MKRLYTIRVHFSEDFKKRFEDLCPENRVHELSVNAEQWQMPSIVSELKKTYSRITERLDARNWVTGVEYRLADTIERESYLDKRIEELKAELGR